MHNNLGGQMEKLFVVIPLLFLFCFTFACQDKEAMAELEEYRAQAKLEGENKTLALRLKEASLKKDFETIKELVSPDYVYHDSMGRNYSLEEMIEGMKRHKAMLSDVTIKTEDLIVKGDKIVVRNTVKATHTGDIEGLPATGNKVEIRNIMIFRIENGKPVEGWEVLDLLSFYQQLGFELKPKEEK
jgi:steroid delta-isomerase-like uncharacterized protein